MAIGSPDRSRTQWRASVSTCLTSLSSARPKAFGVAVTTNDDS